jgi:hypothetical protein
MTRYSSKSRDEVPEKDSDRGQRRTKPADQGPPSLKAVSDIYAKGRERPDLAQGDKRDLQKPQSPEDQRQKNYHNDVPLKGERAFLRGGGEGSIYGTKNTRIPHGSPEMGLKGQETARKRAEAGDKYNNAGAVSQPSGRFTGTGQDMPKSPFSAAHKTYGED